MWRLIGRISAGMAVLLLGFVGWVYVASESHLRSFPRPPAFAVPIPTDAAAVERGAHLVQTRGCRGCHGADLAGQQMWEVAVAPNLPALVREQTAATFEAALRHGIASDGTAMYSMPSYTFLRLRDADVADIIAYLRSVPVVARELPQPRKPWLVRMDIAMGRDDVVAGFLYLVPPLHNAPEDDSPLARGEYIAMTACAECHGFDLHGSFPWGEGAPNLVIVQAYEFDDFHTLMKTGIALGGRELDMMSGVARTRFANFSEQEISDLYAFLRDRAANMLAR